MTEISPITVGSAVLGLSAIGKSLIEKVLGPSAQAIGEYLSDRVAEYLKRNRTRVINDAAQLVLDAGREPSQVPLRTLIPLLSAASLEEDAELSARWSALLANASTAEDPDDVPPLYAHILGQLTPLSARVLEVLVKTDPLPERLRAGLAAQVTRSRYIDSQKLSREIGESNRERTATAIDILIANGLATRSARGQSREVEWYGTGGAEIRITALGRRFLRACQRPSPRKQDSKIEGEYTN